MKKALLVSVIGLLIGANSTLYGQEVRTISGESNNLLQPKMGAVHGQIIRVTSNGYADLVAEPAGLDRPNPRKISNYLFAQDGLIDDPRELSDYAWVFGQFIDHDIVAVEENKEEFMPIRVPAFDAHFDPSGTGQVIIPMSRSAFDENSGTSPDNPRKNTNDITAWLDASNVYGSDVYKANWLRTFQGGKLKTSPGNYLPYNTIDGTINGAVDIDAPSMAMENPLVEKWFIAGDFRANENSLLASMHTLFVREHNRIAAEILAANPTAEDEIIYQAARRKVGALIQSIVYNEWLPTLGMKMPVYQGYDPSTNADIMNVFSAAAFRYGHTTINSNIIRMDNNGAIMPQGNTTLREAFFNPQAILDGDGIAPLLKGMATQVQQEFDCKMVDDLRNFLFGQPGEGGLDLAALNIQRGRDRGLSDYNTIRADFGMERIKSFSELTSDPHVNQIFADLYQDINNIDPWVGLLAEDHIPDALFGPTAMLIIEEQFKNLRDGDRFYFENDPAFSADELREIRTTKLADIIRRNMDIEIQDEVFMAAPPQQLTTVNEPIVADNQIVSFPNPTTGSFTLEFSSLINGGGTIEVINTLGQEVVVKNINLDKGFNQFQIELSSHLTNGIYQVLLKGERGAIATKILLLK